MSIVIFSHLLLHQEFSNKFECFTRTSLRYDVVLLFENWFRFGVKKKGKATPLEDFFLNSSFYCEQNLFELEWNAWRFHGSFGISFTIFLRSFLNEAVEVTSLIAMWFPLSIHAVFGSTFEFKLRKAFLLMVIDFYILDLKILQYRSQMISETSNKFWLMIDWWWFYSFRSTAATSR